MDRVRMSASEREALIRVGIAREIMHNARGDLTRRAGMIPYGKRDLAMLTRKLERLLEDLLETIPTEQLVTLKHNMDAASYCVGVRSPGSKDLRDEYGLWLSYEQIAGLVEGCHDKCIMCNLDGTLQRKCPLRKTFDLIGNDKSDSRGGCPYFGEV